MVEEFVGDTQLTWHFHFCFAVAGVLDTLDMMMYNTSVSINFWNRKQLQHQSGRPDCFCVVAV